MGEKWIKEAGMHRKLKFLAVLVNFDEISRESSITVYFEDADLERKGKQKDLLLQRQVPQTCSPAELTSFITCKTLHEPGRPLGWGPRNGSGV